MRMAARILLASGAMALCGSSIAHDLSESAACRNIDEMGEKTVVEFYTPFRLMDFCSKKPVDKFLLSNSSDQWLIDRMDPPSGTDIRTFFTVSPESEESKPNNVILYFEDGSRQEFWFKFSEKSIAAGAIVEAFQNAYSNVCKRDSRFDSKQLPGKAYFQVNPKFSGSVND